MKIKIAIGGLAMAALAGSGAWLASGGCAVDKTVAEPHRERDLKAEEVRTMLTSGDFKQKLEAQKQIDKLSPDEQLKILNVLATDRDSAVRLIAVKKLKKLRDPRAKETLGKLAKDDPDETVRSLAVEP